MIGYVHIGVPKTGSTFIQNFLHQNQAALLRQGILYPLSITDSAVTGCRVPYYAAHNYLDRRPLPALAAWLRRELQQSRPARVIISAERLAVSFTTPQQLAGLRQWLDDLGIHEVHIIAYLREQGTLYTSFCLEQIEGGKTAGCFAITPEEPSELANFADYRALLQRWGEAFGQEQLQARIFEREAFCHGDLLQDFLQAIDLKWQEDFVVPPRANRSPSLLEVELLEALNHFIPGCSFFPGNLKFHIMHYMNPALEPLSADQDLKYVPPPHMLELWRSHHAEGNEWVRRHFFAKRPQLFSLPDPMPENTHLQTLSARHWEALARGIASLAQHDARVSRELSRLSASLNESSPQSH